MKGEDSQPNRCRNMRASFTCHIELMNLFLQVCETEEFIQHSFIQQVCTEWLWCTWHSTKRWGHLKTCLSRYQHLLPDLGSKVGGTGVELAPGKMRSSNVALQPAMLHANLPFLPQGSGNHILKIQMIFPYKDRKPCPLLPTFLHLCHLSHSLHSFWHFIQEKWFSPWWVVYLALTLLF